MSARPLRSALLLVALAAPGCDAERPSDAPAPPPAPLHLRFSGCVEVDRGPVCRVGAEALVRLSVDAPGPYRVEGGVIDGDASAEVVRVRPTAGGAALTISAGDRRATLALAAVEPHPPLDTVADQPPPAALSVLEAARADAAPALAARLDFQIGRLSNRTGDVPGALVALERTARGAAETRQLDLELRAHLLRAFLLIRTRDFAGAEATLSACDALPGDWAEGAALLAYHRAVLARERGDYRAAAAALDTAGADARRFETGLADPVLSEEAALWQVLGRPDEVDARLCRALDGRADDCTVVTTLGNLAWARLTLREQGRTDVPAATPLLARMRALEATCGQHPGMRLTTRLNEALDALQRGDTTAAAASLAETTDTPDDVESSRWRLDLEARLALSRGGRANLEAAAKAYTRLQLLGEAAGEPVVAWRAATGQGRVHAAAGRRDAAITAWGAAEALLDTAVARVPVDAGRQRFLGDTDASARLLTDALVAAGRTEDAMRAARRARTRALAAVSVRARLFALAPEARAAWQRDLSAWRARHDALEAARAEDWRRTPAELQTARAEGTSALAALEAEMGALLDRLGQGRAGSTSAPLPALAADTAELTLFPGESGVHAFVRHGDAVRALALGPAPATDVADWVMRGALAALGDATQVRVLAHGALRAADLHAARAGGAPVIDRFRFVYPLDVAAPPPAAETGRIAALVADARGDLAAAGVEADAVAAGLRAAGFQVADDLRGRAADAAHVRALLGRADLLHYAGHGELAGRDGFESALLLAGEDRLGVGELLLLPRVPAHVVVSACESGRAPVADKLAVEGLGVAQALVLAGSRQVIATTRPVADAAARRLMEAVYAQLRPDAPVDLAAALATAQRTSKAPDWAAFRVLVP